MHCQLDVHTTPKHTKQFYLVLEGQLTLLTEPNDFVAPGCRPRQFYLMLEGQLTLLTEPNDYRAPGCRPRQFYLM